MAARCAAHHALPDQWPTQRERFDALLGNLCYSPDASVHPASPVGLDNLVAHKVLAARRGSGSNATTNYADVADAMYPLDYAPVTSADPVRLNVVGLPVLDPSRWQPLRMPWSTMLDGNGYPMVDPTDPSSYGDRRFLTPHWGSLRTFAQGDPAAYLPPSPPQRGFAALYGDALGPAMANDEVWNFQFDHVRTFNAGLGRRSSPSSRPGGAHVQLAITSGPRFGSSYAPADLDQRAWGVARFRFTNCNHGTVAWTPAIAGFEEAKWHSSG